MEFWEQNTRLDCAVIFSSRFPDADRLDSCVWALVRIWDYRWEKPKSLRFFEDNGAVCSEEKNGEYRKRGRPVGDEASHHASESAHARSHRAGGEICHCFGELVINSWTTCWSRCQRKKKWLQTALKRIVVLIWLVKQSYSNLNKQKKCWFKRVYAHWARFCLGDICLSCASVELIMMRDCFSLWSMMTCWYIKWSDLCRPAPRILCLLLSLSPCGSFVSSKSTQVSIWCWSGEILTQRLCFLSFSFLQASRYLWQHWGFIIKCSSHSHLKTTFSEFP